VRVKRGLLAAALGLLIAIPSCSGLLELDGYSDATGELCDLFRTCYQFDCAAQVGNALGNADASGRASWLAALSDQGCLEQCSAARRCLNIEPVCLPEKASCTRTEQCCGFLNGATECGAPTGGDSVCCRSQGATCASNDDCCDGNCDRSTSTCGGTVCASVGEVCKNAFDCCSGKCGADHRCEPNLCSQEGFACAAQAECCVGLSCTAGVCGKGIVCRADGEECEPTGNPPCCDQLPCVPIGNSKGLCRSCLQGNEPCDPDDPKCCEGQYCDPYKKLCGNRCVGPDQPCENNFDCCSTQCDRAAGSAQGTCACSKGSCVDDTDCCDKTAGQCVGGSCQLDCKVGTSCHNACVAGPAMKKDCSPCVATVCADDPFCCCQLWDDLCVDRAFKTCTAACKDP
jgi:hypothetical protein